MLRKILVVGIVLILGVVLSWALSALRLIPISFAVGPQLFAALVLGHLAIDALCKSAFEDPPRSSILVDVSRAVSTVTSSES